MEFLSDIWFEYINGRCSIRKVIDEYKKHGFQANQDFPGHAYWEELFHASPNAKVILTVRDSTEEWKRSLIHFFEQDTRRFGNPGFWLLNRMAAMGWSGPRMNKICRINEVKIDLTALFSHFSMS